MAEAAVQFILEKCYEWLAPEVVKWLCDYDVHDKVRTLQGKLQWIRADLKDADNRYRDNEKAKLWMKKMREISYDAEDAIEDFIIMSRQAMRQRPSLFSWNPFSSKQPTLSSSNLRHAAKEVDNIISRLKEAIESKSAHGIESIGDNTGGAAAAAPRREKNPHRDGKVDVVGMDGDVSLLVRKLTQGKEQCCLVSIVGMGGLGKTTLAKKIYYCPQVSKEFQLRAWVFVSYDFRVKEMLQDIIRSISTLRRETLNEMNLSELIQKLHELLTGKSYLIVLDDIWHTAAWEEIVDAFPKEKRSGILFTTRRKDVVERVAPEGYHHELKCLEKKESWTLFCKKAFPKDQSHCCPPDLVEFGGKIVEKCHGLPLAIVVLAGLLSTKKNNRKEWEKVMKSINWQLFEGEQSIEQILDLSYYDLPYQLKCCFLYFAAFPEGYEVPTTRLIRLWVAEGFVVKRDEESMEDVAEDCLNELLCRSMIEVAKMSAYEGIKACRIHDLLHGLAIRKAKEDEFFEVHRKELATGRHPSLHISARRLSLIQCHITECISHIDESMHLHSLLSFPAQRESLSKDQWKSNFGFFKFLRVLILDGLNISSDHIVEDKIVNLKHLRYLGLKNTGLKVLPSTTCNLFNLQTLDIRENRITNLPDDIWELHELRHLRMDNNPLIEAKKHKKVQGPTDAQLRELINLQTLTGVAANDWMEEGLSKLINLTKLGVCGDLFLYNHVFSKVNLTCLKSLILSSKNEGQLPALSSFSHIQRLYSMYLSGRLEKLTNLKQFPSNLTKLTLTNSWIEQDSLETLEMLQNLRILRLHHGSYVGKKMVCSAYGFRRLKVIRLEKITELEEWIVEKGAMPNLSILEISYCKQLNMLPEGLPLVTSLQELKIKEMTEQFNRKLRKIGGLDWYKIEKIPLVTIM